MTEHTARAVGFIGLGMMGEPMASNLAKAGMPIVVWNRTPEKTAPLERAGAAIAATAAEVFSRTETIILMLADGQAIDAVLGRETSGFVDLVRGKTIIHMGTTAPATSLELEAALNAADASYVEAPVSGSRLPAEAAQLVAMLAGAPALVDRVRPLLKPMCREALYCGPVPSALLMKLAVNVFLLPLVTALAESMHFAQRHGLNLEQLVGILDAGPMASLVSRTKARKLASRDFAVQASVTGALYNCRLTAEAARQAGLATPLIDVCHALYGEALDLGLADADMVSVVRALERRTSEQT
jgi:3-hydroxyisobutyrate dehydrogenase